MYVAHVAVLIRKQEDAEMINLSASLKMRSDVK